MILGIDQGTTGTRARLVDREGRVLGQSYKTHAQIHPRPGWVEHDPTEIWNATREVMAGAIGSHGVPSAIGIANQGETVLLWDRQTGEPLSNAIVWQDTRTEEAIALLAGDEATRTLVTRKTGLLLDAYFSASKIRWLLDNVPNARNRAAKGHICAGTIDAWLVWKLSAGRHFVTDPSTAARTLLFDIHTLAYDDELLALFDVPRGVLPEIRPSAGDFAHTSDGVPICASLVDQPAAMFGQGCLAPGQCKATFGTGCFVYMNTGEKPRASAHGLLTTVAWRRDETTTYALDGGIFAAGSVVNWLRDRIGLGASDAELDGLAASVASADGVVCVPALAGLGAPYWQRGARAAWLGMGLSSTRAHLVRAALAGIACRVTEVVSAMKKDAGRAMTELRVDGGLAACGSLMQMQADLLGIPIAVSAETEATVMGACYLAARASGMWDDDARVLSQLRTAREYEPRISSDEREATLTTFARAARLVEAWR